MTPERTDRPPRVGTVVVDRVAGRPTAPRVAVVVATRDATAAEVVIPALGMTVAAVNPGSPATDPVVDVVFVGDLDSTVAAGVWRAWPASAFGLHYQQWTNANGALDTYSYPVSRLIPLGAVVGGAAPGSYLTRAKRALEADANTAADDASMVEDADGGVSR